MATRLSSLSPTPKPFPLSSPTSTLSSSPLQTLNTCPNSNPSNSPFSSISISSRNPNPRSQLKSVSLLERSLIGAAAGVVAGAFPYLCLLPIDTIKTKLQTKGAAQIYSSALDAAFKTFRSDGILGFYRVVSAVLMGSASSSAIYWEVSAGEVTELPSDSHSRDPRGDGQYRLIGHYGPKGVDHSENAGGRCRPFLGGILSYSSFEYLKGFVLGKTGKGYLEPLESVRCGALAGAISASLTTPLDVVKTRLMTQVQGQSGNKITETVRQILLEEGLTGLTRGIGPRVLHSACFAALGYFAFETARLAILNKYIDRRKEAVINEAVPNQ